MLLSLNSSPKLFTHPGKVKGGFGNPFPFDMPIGYSGNRSPRHASRSVKNRTPLDSFALRERSVL
ncbi:MAG TPA: hypothetical protein PLM34_00500 [Lentimicrobium sp.]|nr:hypothetical protein [Lentimicrobium sp.]